MAINERLIDTKVEAAGNGGTGNQEEGLILHLDANDVDSYDGDGSVWYDITNHEYTPATNADEHFNTVLYNTNGSATSITGVGFEPELVWIKRRDSSGSNYLFDQVRGVHKALISEQTYAEIDNSGYLTSFDSDGFSLGTNSALVGNGNSYVAWCFKAGGAPSGSDKVSIDGTSYATMSAAGLTDGTEPISKLSVNTKLGFSIVKYTAPALRVDTVAHGLGQTPEMIILKSTSVIRNWNVFHKDVGISKNLHLNTTDAANTSEDWTANSTTFSIQDYSSSADWVAYCFASKRGVSKVGSYKGTGTASNKVYTGFQPAFVMIKNTTSASSNWMMYDIKRDTDGTINAFLEANTSDAEATAATASVSPNADGFTLGNSNSVHLNESGDTFIYLAFAKNTKETSLIPDTDLALHLDAGDSTTTSSNWDDLSSNTYGETLTGVSFDKELGNWFTFTGGSEHRVSINDDGALTNVSNFTVEMWANIKDNNGYRYLWSNMYSTNGQRQVYCYVDSSDSIEFTVYSGNGTNDYKIYITSSVASTIHNKWVHYAFVLSNGLPSKIYLNGVDTPISAGSTGSGFGSAMHTSSTADFAIGSVQNTGDTLNANGDIGQFRIYSSALTQDQVRQNYNFTKPSYPNGYNGTISGATWNSGGYFNFDGINDTILIGSSMYKSLPMTVGAWVNPLLTGNSVIYSNYDGSAVKGFYIRVNTNGQIMVDSYSNPSGTYYRTLVYSVTNLTANEWSHVAVTFSTSYVKIYVDGEFDSQTSTNSNGITFTPSFSTLIGARDGTADEFYGKIGQVRVYSKELSASEVTALHSEGQ
jgi:hypothetical protein